MGRRFHSIVFQFPHIPGPPRMHLNRRLLAGFFSSGVALLHSGGTMQVRATVGGWAGLSVALCCAPRCAWLL